MSLLEVSHLTVRYGDLTIVDDVSFCADAGERLMIVGPNGAGKSTLVNAIMQSVPYTGEVRFDGVDVAKLKPVERARRLGMLMQNHFVGYAFSVEEIVSLGRYAYRQSLFAPPVAEGVAEGVAGGVAGGVARGAVRGAVRGVFKNTAGGTTENARHIEQALEQCGLHELRKQSVLTLSGGELQRTFLAQVFAQDPQMLILDEPTNHLDLVFQKRILELVETWLTVKGKAVITVVHDLTLAKAFATKVMLMDKGKVVALDTPKRTLSPERLQAVYGMDVKAWMQSLLAQWV